MSYFKVCTRIPDNKFISFSAPYCLVMEYGLDQWTEARVGGLLVFDNLADTVQMLLQCSYDQDNTKSNLAIFEVKVKTPVVLPPSHAGWGECLEVYKDLWGNPNFIFNAPNGDHWPSGTLAFKKIKPIREVSIEELFGKSQKLEKG